MKNVKENLDFLALPLSMYPMMSQKNIVMEFVTEFVSAKLETYIVANSL